MRCIIDLIAAGIVRSILFPKGGFKTMLSNKLSVVLSVCVVCILSGAAFAQGPLTSYRDNSVVSADKSTNDTGKSIVQLKADLEKAQSDWKAFLASGRKDEAKRKELLQAKQLAEYALKDAIGGTNYNAITFLGTGGSGTSSGSSGIMLGFHHEQPDKKTVSLFLNLNGEKTITGPKKDRVFGSSVLNPGTEGFGGFLELSTKMFYPTDKRDSENDSQNNQKLSVYGRFGFSELKWQKEKNDGSLADPVSGYVLYASAGVQHILSSQMSVDNPSQLASQIGIIYALTYRRIGGDLIGDTKTREALLGTSKQEFWGGEITLFARTKSAQPYIRISLIEGGVKGLSDVQAFAGIDVLGDAASIK